jgi:hypothetical protein
VITNLGIIRNRLLKERGVQLAKLTRKPKTIDDIPAPYPKTRAMKYLELKYNKHIEDLIFKGTIYEVEKRLGMDATTVSKWRKLISAARDKEFWDSFTQKEVI